MIGFDRPMRVLDHQNGIVFNFILCISGATQPAFPKIKTIFYCLFKNYWQTKIKNYFQT